MCCRLHFLPSVFWLGLSCSPRGGMIAVQVCSLINSKRRRLISTRDYFFDGITLHRKVSHNTQYWILIKWGAPVLLWIHRLQWNIVLRAYKAQEQKKKVNLVGDNSSCMLTCFKNIFGNKWQKFGMNQNLLKTQKCAWLKKPVWVYFPLYVSLFTDVFICSAYVTNKKNLNTHFLSC